MPDNQILISILSTRENDHEDETQSSKQTPNAFVSSTLFLTTMKLRNNQLRVSSQKVGGYSRVLSVHITEP